MANSEKSRKIDITTITYHLQRKLDQEISLGNVPNWHLYFFGFWRNAFNDAHAADLYNKGVKIGDDRRDRKELEVVLFQADRIQAILAGRGIEFGEVLQEIEKRRHENRGLLSQDGVQVLGVNEKDYGFLFSDQNIQASHRRKLKGFLREVENVLEIQPYWLDPDFSARLPKGGKPWWVRFSTVARFFYYVIPSNKRKARALDAIKERGEYIIMAEMEKAKEKASAEEMENQEPNGQTQNNGIVLDKGANNSPEVHPDILAAQIQEARAKANIALVQLEIERWKLAKMQQGGGTGQLKVEHANSMPDDQPSPTGSDLSGKPGGTPLGGEGGKGYGGSGKAPDPDGGARHHLVRSQMKKILGPGVHMRFKKG